MKQCNCQSIAEATEKLNEQGLKFNDFEIEIKPCSVFLRVRPYAEIRIPMIHFKRFAEWYLEDQSKEA